MRRRLILLLALALGVALAAVPALAQAQECAFVDDSTEEVVEGVTLTWDSSFLCADAPSIGEYTITANVANDSSSSSAVHLNSVTLRGTTPRRGGVGPEVTFSPEVLDLTVNPGESVDITITGTYELVVTDEGSKANIHLSINGTAGDDAFALGVNVAIRGTDATENGGDDNPDSNGGPPFPVPPSGPNAGGQTEVALIEVAQSEVAATDDVGVAQVDENNDEDDLAGLEEAIAELSEEIPGDANEVRANVKTMLEFILANAGNGEEDEPGAFGKGVAALAGQISDEDNEEDAAEAAADAEADAADREADEEEREAEGGGGPPAGVPGGRP